MRKREQNHSAPLTTNVRAFDKVENPSTLGGRTTLGDGCSEGG